MEAGRDPSSGNRNLWRLHHLKMFHFRYTEVYKQAPTIDFFNVQVRFLAGSLKFVSKIVAISRMVSYFCLNNSLDAYREKFALVSLEVD